MAQNEVQKYQADSDFYAGVRDVLDVLYDTHDALEKMSNFLNLADAATYPDIPSATLADLGALRTAVNTYLAAQSTIDMLDECKKFVRI